MNPNLRSRESWKVAISKRTGEPSSDVIESCCERFTINRAEMQNPRREIFIAWRRRTPPDVADLIGGYATADLARDACHRYAEAKG